MSTLQIGRVVLEDIESFENDGDTVTVAGWLGRENGTEDLDTGLWQRVNLLGLAAEDQPVPVFTDDATDVLLINGFYWVTGCSVRQIGPSFGSGTFEFTVRLRPVAGHAAPLIESVMLGAFRSGDAELSAGDEVTWHAVPGQAQLYLPQTGTTGWLGTEAARASADGPMRFFSRAGSSSPNFHDARVRWQCPPENWYVGAATLELGDSLGAVVGSQIPNLAGNWRLHNGLVGIEPATPGSDDAIFTVDNWDTSQWTTGTSFSVGSYNTGTYNAWTDARSITVLRNTPEEVIVRLAYATDFSGLVDGYVDLGLRRGDRLIRVYATALPGLNVLTIFATTPEAAATLNDGIRANANDAFGNRWVIAGAGIVAEDLTNGALRFGASMSAAVGFEFDGSSSTGQETAQNLVHQFYAADTERALVVAR